MKKVVILLTMLLSYSAIAYNTPIIWTQSCAWDLRAGACIQSNSSGLSSQQSTDVSALITTNNGTLTTSILASAASASATAISTNNGTLTTSILSSAASAASTAISTAIGNISAAGMFLAFSAPGLTSIVVNQISGVGKVVRAMTMENITAVASSFSCAVNPVFTLYDCGTSPTDCTTGRTAIGAVTITSANAVIAGSISSASLAAAHYWAWEASSGTCIGLTAVGTAEGKMQ